MNETFKLKLAKQSNWKLTIPFQIQRRKSQEQSISASLSSLLSFWSPFQSSLLALPASPSS